MENTGERQIPSIPGTLEGLDPKHVQRYEFASAIVRGKKVFDVACGTGYGKLLLQARKYYGFDISAETIEYARQYYSGDNSEFLVADASSMSDEYSKAEAIVSFETIEHLQDPGNFLDWCARHTDLLIISSPIRGSFPISRFHLFEYRLVKFQLALEGRYSKVNMFIQNNGSICYPCLPGDRGVAIAICQR